MNDGSGYYGEPNHYSQGYGPRNHHSHHRPMGPFGFAYGEMPQPQPQPQLPAQDHMHVHVHAHSHNPGSMQQFIAGAPDNRFSKFLQLLEKAEYPDSQANPLTAKSEFDHRSETTTSLVVLAPSNVAFEGMDDQVSRLDALEIRRLIECHTLRTAGCFRIDAIFAKLHPASIGPYKTLNVDCEIEFNHPKAQTPSQSQLFVHGVKAGKVVKTAMVLDTAGFAGNNGHIYEVDALFVSA